MAGTDFGINFGAGLGVNMVTALGRQARYCYQFDELVADMGEEQRNLISTRDGMQCQHGKDKANSKEPSGDLQMQLKAANFLLDKVEILRGKAESKRSCCLGVCPNCICRYFVGKKAEKKTEAMKHLNEKLRQKLLSAHRLSLRYILPSEDFTLFKCTEEARKKFLMALRDDEKLRIGLCGMGGCGKTSLLRELHKELQDSKVYKTAFAVVSNPPNYQAIQDSIANWIGLVFETEKNVSDRAARLSMAFEEGRKYLVILDDVWQVLDFKAIGIPVGENCKVLLSSRQQHIFDLMKFDAVIYMSLLTREEAWELFRKHAGEMNEAFQQVAREITDECHRLPVAIKAVASTLRGKELFAWNEALATLKDRTQTLDIEKGLEDPYRCLKFSFDELKDPEEVSLFLLCALFPNDSEISIDALIRFAFALDIFRVIDSYQRARSKVRTAIDKFKNYGLLLQEERCVKLHDMFHALALREAKNKTQVIMGPRQIVYLTKADYMMDTTRLYCHGIEEFPDQLNCPELEILIVSNNSGYSSKIPDMLFKEMMKLKALAMKNTSPGAKPNLLLPQSIEGLKKLRTLCLRGWTLINISMFERLEGLDTIELLDCVMKDLPKELANLKALKLLHVGNCKIGGNPYKVLATCSHLEELYFVENHLPEMVQIGQNVPELFHQIGSCKVLQRYHLEIGGSINTSKDDSTSKLISMNNFDFSITNELFQALPQTLEVLLFENIQGDCKSIIPDMFPIQGECLNELKEFVLRDSDCIKYLIDTTSDQLYQTRIIFAMLQKLRVEAMQCLEALCHGPPPSGLFEKLRKLFIANCSQLNALFTTFTAQKLVMLEVLEVIGCAELRYIIKVEKNEDDLVGLVLPNLKQISVKRCNYLKCILPISVASGLLKLESLEIEDAAKLQHVFGKDNNEKDQNQDHISIDLPAVKIFKLINLPIIIRICPQNYVMKLTLDKAVVMGCPRLSGIFDLDSEVRQQDGDEAMNQDHVLPMSGDEDFRDGIAKYLMDALPREDQFNSFVKSLHKEKHKLLAKIRELEANTVEPSRELQKQLKEAQDLMLKVVKLEGKAKTSKCYSWVCPKWLNQYNVGKRFTTMTEALKQLNERLASDSLTPIITYSSSGTFIFFESRQMAYGSLLTALRGNNINMIGLCGIGGCGKTSLALEICKVAETLKLFEKVVFVTVSRDLNITTIQDEIASGVGLRFKSSEDESKRASRLYMKLSRGKKFLIVLDDMWEVLKLEDIGIPVGKNCKLILTTRVRPICTFMNCQEEIYLSLLPEDEAWALFQTHAVVEEDTFKDLSLEFTKECRGLPLTIISVARSLKHKPEVMWKEALEELKVNYAPDIDSTMVNQYKCLKLCIDNLQSDELRSLLLLCSLFPEHSNISLKILIKFAFGLGIFEDVDSYERARSKVGAAIASLQESGLLSAKEGQFIHMHDFLCEVALWIAHKTHVTLRDTMVQEAFLGRISVEVTRLYCYNIYRFPYRLNLPKLEILFVSNSCRRPPKFTDAFFEEMIELMVLAIINTFVQGKRKLLLPQSIDGLKNLRTLCLNGWILLNISILGELKMLGTIELLCCVIEELPNEFAKLKRLKSLEVSWSSIGCDPFEVLAKCSQLEELYFVGNDLHEKVSDVHVVQLLHQIASSEVLQRYHLEIGVSRFTLENDLRSKVISLNDFHFDALPSETIKNLSQELEVFYLRNIKGRFHNISPGMIPVEGQYMNELIELSLCDSDIIECLIDNMDSQFSHDKIVFSKLLKLKLFDMGRLKALCYGHPPSGLFEKLEELLVIRCEQLPSIVSSDMLNLCNLKYLRLRDCAKLEYLFTSSTAQTMISLEVLKVKNCPNLKYIITYEGVDDLLTNRMMFLKLKQVSFEGCYNMRYIMPVSFAGGFSELEILKIKDAPALEYIFGEDKDAIVQHLKQCIDLPVLKVFKLTNLSNIVSIAPENYYISWPSLDDPRVSGCPNLISMSDSDSEQGQQSDDEVTDQDLELSIQLSCPIIEPAIKMESNSGPEGLPQPYRSSEMHLEDEQESKVKVEEECCHDDIAEDKGETEAEKDKEEKYGIPQDSNRVIEQSATCCMESRELDEELIKKQPKVELELPLVFDDQQEALEEQKAKNSHAVQAAVEVHIQSQKFDVIDETREGLQEKNFDPVCSVNLRESDTEIATLSFHRDYAPDESTARTSSEVWIGKQPQIVMDPQQALQEYKAMLSPSISITTTSTSEAKVSSSKQQNQIVEEIADFHGLLRCAELTDEAFAKAADSHAYLIKQDGISAPHQEMLSEDSNNEVQGASEFQLHSENLDKVVDIHNNLQEKHLYPVGSMNSRESTTEIVKGCLYKDSASEKSTVGSSSQVKLERSQVVMDPQQVLEEYKVPLPLPVDPATGLSQSTTIKTTPPAAEAPTPTSPNQHPPTEELVDFHGLFKIKTRHAHLLEEAFLKYSHLWEWKASQKTLRICKVGLESLADMLAFLKSETPKTMNDSKMEEFENLYYELEYFRFDKMWLASIRQRVMDMQADYSNKLKRLDQLESQISTLEKQLSDARASLAIVKDDISKSGHVFDF